MNRRSALVALIVAGVLATTAASPAFAAGPKAEVGAALASVTMGLGDGKFTVVGVPSSGFGLLNPAIYGSFFVGSSLAIEPQLGLIWISVEGDSTHIVNAAGQLDYFLRGTGRTSPYVFGSVGLFNVSGSSDAPASITGGVGYRIPVGDRLTFRIDGRVTHLTKDGGNGLGFALSMGGLFGRK